MRAEVRYLEIPVAEIERAVRFYQRAFEITLERDEVDGYQTARFPKAQIGADVSLMQGDVYVPTKSGAIVYFHVASIEAVLKRVTLAGGQVLYPQKDIGVLGFVAEFEDSEGNRIALSQSAGKS